MTTLFRSGIIDLESGVNKMTRDERLKVLAKFKKIKCPICGKELKDMFDYDYSTEEWEHQYRCSNCLIDISIEEDEY